MKQRLVQKRFYGGIADDLKEGQTNSFAFGRSLDFRTAPSTLKILPKTTKESASIVVDLIKWFENVGTDTFGVGDTGKFYKRTSAGSWSVIDTLTAASGNGIGYFPYDDYIYLPKNGLIDRYGPMGGTPALAVSYFQNAWNDTFDTDQTDASTGQTYAIPAAISETATNRQTFVPTKDPQRAIHVNVNTDNGGNFVITVHDAANVAVATVTVADADIGTGVAQFVYTTPWQPTIGATYHFHITNTTAGSSIVSGTTNDMETCWFRTHYQTLITDTDYHPCKSFIDKMVFGNGRYLATYNGLGRAAGSSVYNPNRLALFKGWKARDLLVVGEYLAVIAWKGTNIYDYDEGMIYFWDGISDVPNFYIETEGAICAAAVEKKNLYWVTSAGNIYVYDGSVRKLKTLPNITLQRYVDILPGSFKIWRGIPLIGVSYNTNLTNDELEKGVYSYGRLNENYPIALNYDYPISTGTRIDGSLTGDTLKIGGLARTGDTLLIAWRDNTAYGVDVVSNSAAPFAAASWESLIFDNGRPDKEKKAYKAKVTHKALADNETVLISYQINRSGSWTNGTTNSTSNSKETYLNFPLQGVMFYEIQFKITLGASSTSPTILSFSFEFDDLKEEEKL